VLEELLERRERECRLVPELALQTIDEADAWRWRWRDVLVSELVDADRLVRPAPGWLAAPG
jgi:hypothetical protein